MIAITGAHGPVGKYLIPELIRQGRSLRILADQPVDGLPISSWIEGDVFDSSSLELLMDNVDKVYHLDVMDTFDPTSNKEMYRYNIDGTSNVVNAALSKGVKKILFGSTIFSLGDKSSETHYDEGSKWNNTKTASGFGWSMHLAEREIWRGISEGLQGLIINAGIVIGHPSDRSSSNEILQFCLRNGGNYPTGQTHPLDVSDLMKVMIQLMDGQLVNEQFIVSGRALSYRELVQKISTCEPRISLRKELSYSSLRKRVVIERYNFINQHKRPTLTKSLAQALSDSRSYSNQKISQLLSAEFVDLDNSLRRYCGLDRTQKVVV